jgi:hypothetical protein
MTVFLKTLGKIEFSDFTRAGLFKLFCSENSFILLKFVEDSEELLCALYLFTLAIKK